MGLDELNAVWDAFAAHCEARNAEMKRRAAQRSGG